MASAVRRAAVVTHGRPEKIDRALARLESVAHKLGVELLLPEEEVAKHQLELPAAGDLAAADVAVVLGGDGTMLRALHRFLGRPVPVIGVNFGRVGFLAAIGPDNLEDGLARVFAGEYLVVELPTLVAEVGNEQIAAVNDVVVKSASLARMVELGWDVGGESLGRQPCDGLICSTPSGSTAYNLSNGGPVLVRGLDAMVVTFIAPHSLHARPLVIPRGLDLTVRNETPDVPVTVLYDGREFTEASAGEQVVIRLGSEKSLLGTLPETTFLRRYHETFAP